MNKNNDIIEKLNAPEMKESMKKIVQEKIIKENNKKEKMQLLMSNIDYIGWLITFTKEKESFADTDWDYSNEKLSDSDQEKVNDLQLFFEGIYNYTKKNYIYSTLCSFGEYYNIKIGDIGFEIGYLTGQGTMFYCKRVDIEDNFIDFMDIISNKKQDNVDYIEKELSKLSNEVLTMYNNGVPIDSITETLNVLIHSIAIKEKEEAKVLKKI